MKCIGKNNNGYLRICACYSRQIKGCENDEMKFGKDVSINFLRVIQGMDWDKTTICEGCNERGEDGRTCLCLGGQKQKSCDPKMRIVSVTKADVSRQIEDLNC